MLISSLLTKPRQSWCCHGFSPLSFTNGPQCRGRAKGAGACAADHIQTLADCKASSETAFYSPSNPGDCFHMLPTWLHIIFHQDHNPGSLIKKRGMKEGQDLVGGGWSPGSGPLCCVPMRGLPLSPQITTCNLSLEQAPPSEWGRAGGSKLRAEFGAVSVRLTFPARKAN